MLLVEASAHHPPAPRTNSPAAALVSTIVLVSLNFDAQKVEGLLMWVQDNPRQGSFLFLVRCRSLAGGQGLFKGAGAAADGVAAAAVPLPCPLVTRLSGHAAAAACTQPPLRLLLWQGMYTAGVVLMVPAMVMAMAAGAVFGMVRPLSARTLLSSGARGAHDGMCPCCALVG